MKLTSKSMYALRALLTLAVHPQGVPLPVRVLAEKNQIPIKFLEQILTQLKKSGLLISVAGSSGGYLLARGAAEITLGQVIAELDGEVALVACLANEAHQMCSCANQTKCNLRVAISEVQSGLNSLLDSRSLQSVLDQGARRG